MMMTMMMRRGTRRRRRRRKKVRENSIKMSKRKSKGQSAYHSSLPFYSDYVLKQHSENQCCPAYHFGTSLPFCKNMS